jgi:hypothetical protein
MVRTAIYLALAAVLATPAAAQITFGDTTQPAQAANAKGKDPSKIICERQEEMGSRLGGKKVCKTSAEWQEERAAQRRVLEDTQRQATSTGAPAG